MKNRLPPFKTFSIDKKFHDKKFSEWQPDASDPNNCTNVYGIQCEFSPEEPPIEWRAAPRHCPDPNNKYRSDIYSKDESPLCEAQRGQTEAPRIVLPRIDKGDRIRPPDEKLLFLPTVFNIYNSSVSEFDIFIKNENSFKNLSISPFCTKSCSFSTSIKSEDIFHIFLSDFKYGVIVINERQWIRQIEFEPGPIGLEVEQREYRVICTGVVQDSQASQYSEYIIGTEIIAVNGNRVCSIDHFQELVKHANSIGSIVMSIAAYKTPRKKIDDLYAYNLSNKNTVKSLLSNLFNSGANKSYSANSLSTDDDDEEENEEEDDNDNNDDVDNVNNADEDKESNHGKDLKEEDHKETSEIDTSDRHSILEKDDLDECKEQQDNMNDDMQDDEESSVLQAPRRMHSDKSEQISGPDADDVVEESVVAEGQSVVSVESQDSFNESGENWEYKTALDDLEMSPYLKTVCLLPILGRSNDWGKPKEIMHIANHSTKRVLYIYWIDDDGNLIFRNYLPPGAKHADLISAQHSWILASHFQEKKTNLIGNGGINRSTNEIPDMENADGMIFRPSVASLSDIWAVVAVWVPTVSVSLSRRSASKFALPKDLTGPVEIPKLIIQVFDSPSK